MGLKVLSITSDMGPVNVALWRKWGIVASRNSRISNSITHPLDESRKIYIFADVPHVFKNLKNMLVTHKTLYISDEMQTKHNLPTNIIDVNHIVELIAYQKDFHFQLAPGLHEEDVLPDHLKKMKVKTSTNIINHNVASGLKYMAEELKKPEYLTLEID